MSISSRIEATIESWSTKWRDRLRGWMASWVTKGLNTFLEVNEPEAVDLMQAQLLAIRDDKHTPQVLKDFINKITAGKKPLPVVILVILGAVMVIPMIMSIFRPLGTLWEYQQERVTHTGRFDPPQALALWRRDPEKFETFIDDMRDLGFTETRIEAFKALTEIIPGVPDLIRMSVREAFSPEIAEKFGQYQDPPTLVYPWAEKIGLSKEWVDRYWAAHWELPSAGQGFELLHRGIITEDELKMLLRALDVMPYWRDKLIQVSWNVPTRVDVRRFWDMRTIDEARLREVYTAIGYHGKDLDDYVLWTKIYTDFPDLLARYKNGWITLDQVKSELVAIGMKPERADTMIEEKIKKAAPERVAKERDLTAAEIIKGVKKDVISWDEGRELLMDMGYDEDEAAFKLAIEIAAMAGSPESYAEFKDLTQKYRKASGLEGKPMNEEIRKAAAEVIQLTGERDILQHSIRDEERKLVGEEILPAEATERLNQLKASLRKAEAALAAAKTEYNRLVAEGKYT